jgi:hypothetical protein
MVALVKKQTSILAALHAGDDDDDDDDVPGSLKK